MRGWEFLCKGLRYFRGREMLHTTEAMMRKLFLGLFVVDIILESMR